MHVFSYFMDTLGQLHAGQQCIKALPWFRLLKSMQNLSGLVICPWFLDIRKPDGVGMPAIAWLDISVLFFTSRSTVQYMHTGSKAFQMNLNC